MFIPRIFAFKRNFFLWYKTPISIFPWSKLWSVAASYSTLFSMHVTRVGERLHHSLPNLYSEMTWTSLNYSINHFLIIIIISDSDQCYPKRCKSFPKWWKRNDLKGLLNILRLPAEQRWRKGSLRFKCVQIVAKNDIRSVSLLFLCLSTVTLHLQVHHYAVVSGNVTVCSCW